MTSALKVQILDTHNTFRNKVALGEVPRFKPAKRMAQMVWNHQLAYLAELNTKQCKMSHDQCRKTAKFEYPGQNLGEMGTSGPHYDPVEVVKSVLNDWYDEHRYARQSDIDELTRMSDENK